MAIKKNIRANNTYKIAGDNSDNPKLFAQILNDGRESLYLEYYLGFTEVRSKNGNTYKKAIRETERLGIYLLRNPRTPIERQQNADLLAEAKDIRNKRDKELKANAFGYSLPKRAKDLNFLDYYKRYVSRYTKKDIKVIIMGLRRFEEFLGETPEYNIYKQRISPLQINSEMVEAFCEYLEEVCIGTGARSVFARFKKVVRACANEYKFDYKEAFSKENKAILPKYDETMLRKEVLSYDEIATLASTHYDRENPNIRRAFLFCCLTGLRFCDVKDLTFSNVDYSNRLLNFEQSKTKGHSANSAVSQCLNDNHMTLIGNPSKPDNRAELIFPLPSYEMCLKALKKWVVKAGITKHISWHCARHSYAINTLSDGAGVRVLADLLGHSDLKQIKTYTRVIDNQKKAASDKQPKIEFT